MVLAALLVLAISGPLPQWTLTGASAVRAQPVNGGVRITANVTLANACQEAEILAYSGGIPTEYQIVSRTKPDELGRTCTMSTLPTTVSHWFPIKGPNVTVRTVNNAMNVQVKP